MRFFIKEKTPRFDLERSAVGEFYPVIRAKRFPEWPGSRERSPNPGQGHWFFTAQLQWVSCVLPCPMAGQRRFWLTPAVPRVSPHSKCAEGHIISGRFLYQAEKARTLLIHAILITLIHAKLTTSIHTILMSPRHDGDPGIALI